MQFLDAVVSQVNSWLWSYFLLIMLSGVGIILMVGLRFMPWFKLLFGFRQLMSGRSAEGSGEISPFNALMTGMSATVGTGNIVGVATAISFGGPGALFWMWCIAMIGMATKYSEAVLAVRYREKDEIGQYVGGPMYYIKNGLGKKFIWLSFMFAGFGAMAGFGIGNTVQANSIADGLQATLGIPPIVTGVVCAVLAGAVILGGVKRIGSVAGKIVPFMCVAYVGLCLLVILLNIQQLPSTLYLIVHSAFNPVSAVGGFAGASVMMAIRMGVARGIFSNESGLGSSPIAHAAAQTNSPVRQGTIAMLGTFIDTIVICSMTGIVIVLSGMWEGDARGTQLSINAMNTLLPHTGSFVVTGGMVLFAFTTILGWAYYGERCAEYAFGVKVIMPYRILWILVVPFGAVLDLQFVWKCADMLNGLMAVPNLIALTLLSPVVFRLTREYFRPDAKPAQEPAPASK